MTIELSPEHELIAAEARARIQASIAGIAFVSDALNSSAELPAPEAAPAV